MFLWIKEIFKSIFKKDKTNPFEDTNKNVKKNTKIKEDKKG